jgi:hypothetical protein
MKILAVVLACLGVMGVVVIGGIWYAAHRIKEAVVEKAQENGVDLHSIVPPAKTTANLHKTHRACELLSKEEASNLLGEPVERSEYQDSACMYYGPSGLAAKLAQQQMSKAVKKAEAPGSHAVVDITNAADQLANTIGAASGQIGSGGEMPLLILTVAEDGRSVMTALNTSSAIFNGIKSAADPDGKEPSIGGQIKGLGDQAVRMPKLGLQVLQGDTVIGLIPGPVPDSDAKTINLARLVLKRL